MTKITRWIWHKKKKTSKKVRARRLSDNTIEYQKDEDIHYYLLADKVYCNKSYKTTIAKFYAEFESINMTRKCLDCNRYSGWKFYCKTCQLKRQEELNKIANEVTSLL